MQEVTLHFEINRKYPVRSHISSLH